MNWTSIPLSSVLHFVNSGVKIVTVGGMDSWIKAVPVKQVPLVLVPSVIVVISYNPSSVTGRLKLFIRGSVVISAVLIILGFKPFTVYVKDQGAVPVNWASTIAFSKEQTVWLALVMVAVGKMLLIENTSNSPLFMEETKALLSDLKTISIGKLNSPRLLPW